jgi:hypothetical protein
MDQCDIASMRADVHHAAHAQHDNQKDCAEKAIELEFGFF